jgi:hypothetical protein
VEKLEPRDSACSMAVDIGNLDVLDVPASRGREGADGCVLPCNRGRPEGKADRAATINLRGWYKGSLLFEKQQTWTGWSCTRH